MSLSSFDEIVSPRGNVAFFHPKGPGLKAKLFAFKHAKPFSNALSAEIVETYDPGLAQSNSPLDVFETTYAESAANKSNGKVEFRICDSDELDLVDFFRRSPHQQRCAIIADSGIFEDLGQQDKRDFNLQAPGLENCKIWFACENPTQLPSSLRQDIQCAVVHEQVVGNEQLWLQLCRGKTTKLFRPSDFKFKSEKQMRNALRSAFRNQLDVHGRAVERPSDVVILNFESKRMFLGYQHEIPPGDKRNARLKLLHQKGSFVCM